jgi:hypothetical protein
MATEILTAEVAIVSVGQNIQVEGLRLSDGRFAIAISQINKLIRFSASKNTMSRDLKRLLGQRFNPSKSKVVGLRQLINCIFLEDFELFLFEMVILGNENAIKISRALVGLSLKQLFSDAFGINLTPADRQNALDRILDVPDVWEKMYEKEACMKAFAWMGTRFYWDFCYFWLTPAEKIKIDQINPCVRGCRKAKIHQCIEPETKARLTPHVQRLCDLLISSTSKQDFLTRYNRVFGINQQEFAV